MASRPLSLLDLPDEILCHILEYCCDDRDYLLWSASRSSPKGLLHNQCSLCHTERSQQQRLDATQPRNITTQGQASMCHSSNLNLTNGVGRQHDDLNTRSKQQLSLIRHATSGAGSGSTSEAILRKRRRRTIAEGGQGVMAGRGGGAVNGSRRTPAGSRPCCDRVEPHQHHQAATVSHNGSSSSFWSRHLARFVLHPRLREYFRSPASQQPSPSAPMYTAMGLSVMPQAPHWSPQMHCLPGKDSPKPSVAGN